MGKIHVISLQIALCLGVFSVCAIRYIDKQNELTGLRLCIPKLSAEIRSIQEENTQLKYQIQAFESPNHLMELVSDSQYSHLKHPLGKEILVLEVGSALQSSPLEEIDGQDFLLLGAK